MSDLRAAVDSMFQQLVSTYGFVMLGHFISCLLAIQWSFDFRYTNREAANEKSMADARARLQALQGKNKRLYAAYRSLR